jgi:2-amino-4-ketopentanoate thiolase alpha subunit
VARTGEWAEVRLVLLEPGERAPTVSEDTAGLPLEARVRGFLEHDAELGAPASVTTVLGRRVEGTLVDVAPSARHTFGRPQAELLEIGGELRAILDERESPGA